MAIISSPNSQFQPKICKKTCDSCGLSIHQAPIYGDIKKSKIFWVGLSAIKFNQDELMEPLSSFTPSGALIDTIEQPFRQKLSFYKTNLVKCAPIVGDKLRYPLEHEMEKCFPNFQWEVERLEPKTTFLLGKQVATFVLKKLSNQIPMFGDNFNYFSYEINGVKYIPIHHPSYILVYKRKHIDQYIDNVQKLFSSKSNLKVNSCSPDRHQIINSNYFNAALKIAPH